MDLLGLVIGLGLFAKDFRTHLGFFFEQNKTPSLDTLGLFWFYGLILLGS